MREPHTALYVHLVWATCDRMPLILETWQGSLYSCMQAECKQLGCEIVALGGTEDHVHALVRLAPTASISQLMKQMKGASSHLATHELEQPGFKWQGAYGAFSIGEEDIPMIRNYILGQKAHHAEHTTLNDLELP